MFAICLINVRRILKVWEIFRENFFTNLIYEILLIKFEAFRGEKLAV